MCSLAIDFLPCSGLDAGVDIFKMFGDWLGESVLEKIFKVSQASVNKVLKRQKK